MKKGIVTAAIILLALTALMTGCTQSITGPELGAEVAGKYSSTQPWVWAHQMFPQYIILSWGNFPCPDSELRFYLGYRRVYLTADGRIDRTGFGNGTYKLTVTGGGRSAYYMVKLTTNGS